MFLKNRNISFKIKRSKVTDYAALSMRNENLIMHKKLLPTNYLHHSNQAKCIITSNTKNKSNELAHLILYLLQFQEIKAHVSLCKCVDTPEHLLPAYTKYRCRPELRQLVSLHLHGQLMLAFANE